MKILSLFLLLFLTSISLTAQSKNLPPQMKHVAPLIGSWEIHQQQMNPQGQWSKVPKNPTWSFEWALGGEAILDHWISQTVNAENDTIPVYGMNLRVYDPKADQWNVSWVESINRKYVEFQATSTPQEFKMEGKNISGREIRVRFFDYQPNSFKWEQAWTFDQGKTWIVISKMTASRIQKD